MSGGATLVVSTAWLAEKGGAGSAVRVLDGSWHLSTAARDPAAEFLEAHIPGSRSVPFDAVLDADDAALAEAGAIRRAFADAGVDPARPVIATCGSGITACMLALALAAIGAERVAVYDGSWTDWGSRADAPVESGRSLPRDGAA